MTPLPIVKFYNNIVVPAIGLGTNGMPISATKRTIMNAIDLGYRYFDCAPTFCNEREVGEAIQSKIKDGTVKRKELFISSKLWNSRHAKKSVRTACEETLKSLNLKFLDNFVMHSPMGFKDGNVSFPRDVRNNIIFSDIDYLETWAAMEDLVDAGLCRSIGLANFNIDQLKRVLEAARIKPANLQIECHPYLTQKPLINFCAEHKILVMAFSPLGSGLVKNKPETHKYALLQHPQVNIIAMRKGKSPAQILLRYHIQRGIIPVVMTMDENHLADNLNCCDIKLCPKDVVELDCLNFNARIVDLAYATGHPYHPFENACI